MTLAEPMTGPSFPRPDRSCRSVGSHAFESDGLTGGLFFRICCQSKVLRENFSNEVVHGAEAAGIELNKKVS